MEKITKYQLKKYFPIYTAFLIVVIIMIINIYVLAQEEPSLTTIEKGANWEKTCEGNECTLALSSGMYAQNSSGDWVNPSEVLKITRYQDDLTFHYNGVEGYFNITFEAGVIYNTNYYSMQQVKNLTGIQFDFPIQKSPSQWKYAVNITNITLDKSKIESITLTYKDNYGFNLSQLKSERGKYLINNTMGLVFTDLKKAGFEININESERRIYISNITLDKFDGDNLYLDPLLTLSTPDTEVLEDAHTNSFWTDENSGAFEYANVGLESADEYIAYYKFNITAVPSGATINSAYLELGVYYEQCTATCYLNVKHVYQSYSWTETGINYNNRPLLHSGSGYDVRKDRSMSPKHSVFVLNVEGKPAKGGIRDKYSTGNFEGIRKGTMCEYGQTVGGTKNNYWIRNSDNKRIGRTYTKWLSHRFKTRTGGANPLQPKLVEFQVGVSLPEK